MATSLKQQWAGNDFLRITAGNIGRHMAVFEKAVADVYTPHFPRSAGYHNLDGFLKVLQDPGAPVDYQVIVAGNNLRGEEGPVTVKGISIGFYYKGSDTGQLTYLAVDPAFRTEGLGHALFKNYTSAMLDAACRSGKGLLGHYITCQDPAKPLPEGHDHDTYNPQKRLDKYASWGGRRVACDFTIGYTVGGKAYVESDYALLALAHPADNTYPSAKVSGEFLRTLWRSSGITDPDANPDFRRSLKSILNTGGPALAGPKP